MRFLILISVLLLLGCGAPSNKKKSPPNNTVSGIVVKVENLRAAVHYRQPISVTFEDGRIVIFQLWNRRGPFIIKKGEYQIFEIDRSGDVIRITQRK